MYKEEYLKINNELKIPVHHFGNKPKLLLIAGMHGNEQSGVLVLRELIKKLKKLKNAPNVTIVPIANPEAYKANTRKNPVDNIDLNRIFPVKKAKGHSNKIAKKLQEFAEKYETLIDFHVFPKQNTLICGVGLNVVGIKTQKKIDHFMECLDIDTVCLINRKYEPTKNGSLADYLQTKQKTAFGVELPPVKVLTQKEKSDMVKNLAGVARAYHKTIKHKKNTLKNYSRQQYHSKSSGYFSPNKKVGLMIKKNEILGKIKTGRSKVIEIHSPFFGKLISISYERKVKIGEKIFAVGKAR